MPQFNYKANKRTDREKWAIALKRAKKERPVRKVDHSHFPMKHMTVRTRRKDIED